MSFREVVKVLKYAQKIRLFYGDNSVEFNKDDEGMISFFGKYEVESVSGIDLKEGHYEVALSMRPVVCEKE